MKRRDVLRKAGIGITATVGAAGLANAGCGPCEDEICWCDGEWYDCGLEPGGCCDGTIRCDCVLKCECGGPCQ